MDSGRPCWIDITVTNAEDRERLVAFLCDVFGWTFEASGPDMGYYTMLRQDGADVAAVGSGYIYYVSLKGVTGSGALDIDAVEAMLPRIRQHVSVPVGVGFGIRDAATAKAISRVADAVVIGSRLIQLIENESADKVNAVAADFLSGIRQALDA